MVYKNLLTIEAGVPRTKEAGSKGYLRQRKAGKKSIIVDILSCRNGRSGRHYSVDGQNIIIVKGIDKRKLANSPEIRDKRRPEPYKGEGGKYADETIRRKVGKTGKK